MKIIVIIVDDNVLDLVLIFKKENYFLFLISMNLFL